MLRSGDLLKSPAQTLVNTVNCVGVMGKGIALAFKKRYPEMYKDYVRRCDAGQVKLGEPYLYRAPDHLIINFPTKDHWRAVSRLSDIVRGLEHLESHFQEWGVTSIAVPPLGCGNGQLEWDVVGPTLFRHLSRLGIRVDLYPPFDVGVTGRQLELIASSAARSPAASSDRAKFVEPEWVAIVAILDRLQRQQHHWPVGRIMFQKMVYFATQAGVPTGMKYEANSFGPYADQLKKTIGRLQNNGLADEQRNGQLFEMKVGPTYRDAVEQYRRDLEPMREAVERTVDLMARMNTARAEVAASVHFTANALASEHRRQPTASEVLEAVGRWKVHRQGVTEQRIVDAVAVLAMRRWISVALDDAFAELLDRYEVA